MNALVKLSKNKYPFAVRVVITLLAGCLFVFLIPYALLRWLPALDGRLGLPALHFGTAGIVVGAILIVLGAPLGFWTVLEQIIKAGGTPVPVIATQKLLVRGPYTWTRNPMVLGTLTAYLGVSLLASSWCSILIVVIISCLLIVYLKRVEEPELQERFGQSYLDYRRRTSFLFPWPPGHR